MKTFTRKTISRKPPPRILVVLMMLIGIGSLVYGAYVTLERIDFLNKAVQTRGVIVDVVRRGSGSYFPVFQFVDLSGVVCHVLGPVGGVYSVSDIGKEVDIYYDPDNPLGGVVSGFLDMWIYPIALLGFGFVFTVVNTIVFYKFR